MRHQQSSSGLGVGYVDIDSDESIHFLSVEQGFANGTRYSWALHINSVLETGQLQIKDNGIEMLRLELALYDLMALLGIGSLETVNGQVKINMNAKAEEASPLRNAAIKFFQAYDSNQPYSEEMQKMRETL